MFAVRRASLRTGINLAKTGWKEKEEEDKKKGERGGQKERPP